MKALRICVTMLLLLSYGPLSSPQDRKAANLAGAPPNFLVLVQQEIQPGKSSERQKLETALSHACDRLEAPGFWIDLQSLTGPRQALFLDPFDSFEQMHETHSGWRQFYAAHPEIAQMQREIDSLVGSERTLVAIRRDDLSYLAENIDFSEARFLRVLEVRLFPGHENDFVEAARLWNDAYSKIKSDKPTVVYQLREGSTTPAFLILLPMSEPAEYDDLLAQQQNMLEAGEGDGSADRLRQIARESYASTESSLYEVSPEMSHVPKEFASGDNGFWKSGKESELKPEANPKQELDLKPLKKKANLKPSRGNAADARRQRFLCLMSI